MADVHLLTRDAMMMQHDSAWFIENAGSHDRWKQEAYELRQQAESLLRQAQQIDQDRSILPLKMEIFEGQAIDVHREAIYDGRTFVHVSSLPSHRRADVYQRADNPEKWSGNLQAFVHMGDEKVYPSAIYSGGIWLGLSFTEDALIDIAKRWVAFAQTPEII